MERVTLIARSAIRAPQTNTSSSGANQLRTPP